MSKSRILSALMLSIVVLVQIQEILEVSETEQVVERKVVEVLPEVTTPVVAFLSW